ncbi:MAG: hypothetical protein KatS3mg033_1870 [Thermonema sp.]|uniref:energy transducer TonB n=1 Tax=Thermonema TaxID=28194 RepID=UPI000690276A|nr:MULTISPECIES: energy transducer TonB [Thermonema]GIV40070.1 MAG: hypothetical protein KatS3mg033_1870 [Thermonema sp.]
MKRLFSIGIIIGLLLPLCLHAQKQRSASMDAHIVLKAAEVMPEPIGGYESFDRYLQENIRYPLQALENKVEGYVFVRFVVREDGYLVEPVITKGLGYGCDEEVLRVIKNAPPWKPGREGTQLVPVEMTIAVLFRLPR